MVNPRSLPGREAVLDSPTASFHLESASDPEVVQTPAGASVESVQAPITSRHTSRKSDCLPDSRYRTADSAQNLLASPIDYDILKL